MKNQNLHTIYLHIGSNLGDRENYLNRAIQLIRKQIGEIPKVSHIYETAAWGKTDQPAFLNQALEIQTALFPNELMDQLKKIEEEMGRIRKEKWGPRLIDLDMIFYDDLIFEIEGLIIPHPRMHIRNFVLIPMMDLNPDFFHPIFRQTIRELKAWCQDDLEVRKYK